MKIHVLVDDLESPSFEVEHGLSLFVETGTQNVLFDMGTTDMFIGNAERLGLDISAVSSEGSMSNVLDLDDGVKHNYQLFQSVEISGEGTKNQKIDLLAKI